MNPYILPLATAALGSLFFAMFFGIRGEKLVFTALGGFITWGVYLLAMRLRLSEPAAYILGSAAGTLYSEIMARLRKSPATLFIISSVIPMVPGGSLYYTMLGLLQGNREQFMEKGLYTLSAAGCMALGMFAATMLIRLILAPFRYSKKRV